MSDLLLSWNKMQPLRVVCASFGERIWLGLFCESPVFGIRNGDLAVLFQAGDSFNLRTLNIQSQ